MGFVAIVYKMNKPGTEDVTQLTECLLRMLKSCVPSPAPRKLGMVVHAHHPNTEEVQRQEDQKVKVILV